VDSTCGDSLRIRFVIMFSTHDGLTADEARTKTAQVRFSNVLLVC
jgi:hypothetical protein